MIRSNWYSSTGNSDEGIAQLTWYLGGRSASLSQLLPMLQSMGVVVLEERPFTVTRRRRAAGVDLPVPDRAAPRSIPERPRRSANATRPPRGSPTPSPRSGTDVSRSTGSTNWCCAPA